MKKSTGLWIALAAMATGAAIGAICAAGNKCGDEHDKCQCRCGHDKPHHELKDELAALIEKIKSKMS